MAETPPSAIPPARAQSLQDESSQNPGCSSPSSNKYQHASNEQYVDDITLEFFYKPHTITLLILIMFFLIYSAFYQADGSSTEQSSTRDNVVRGVRSFSFAFLLISTVALPNGPFTRPHPAVWRAVLGLTILYWCGLIFALHQSYDDVKSTMIAYDPRMDSKYLDARDSADYASNCEFTMANLYSRFDVFIIAHFVGWIGKALLFRNLTVCWIQSLTWELTEIVFAPLIPNLYECWWDQLLYDVIFCNALGMYIGWRLCRYLEMRTYHWHGIRSYHTLTGKYQRAVMQFTPRSWTKVEWGMFSSIKRYGAVMAVTILITIAELNAFFLKHIFKVSAENPVNSIRLGLWFVMGAPALRQVYVYITDPSCRRLGTQAWTTFGVLMTEVLLIVKFGSGIFDTALVYKQLGRWMLMETGVIVGYLFIQKRLPSFTGTSEPAHNPLHPANIKEKIG
ncbi:hypothetical protein SARC_06842 [Sphaeroforma arctica JP610]|uniref:L-serine-phosphatidylethanolamine phosphatidyltransferase n=1 Tax=Sphaeroforma arctica JP610 TaxID=667725 RepID=A0A0L0FVC1_9EUKA|nr:hypothetical protein SARC_06842 [Sphaeroforma arctica JP610]KNC80805.1 hypothetical protein SARC_06842 [Sphaeroforma arctica JP610]|eukprot:XP_014154707.1 hypothetical protein SARC_06842 [Sphaeroforma arctica JP610]